ncbi:MAG: glycosyltransferase family 39 protein, partial [Bacteroidota bacterium]
LIMNEYTTIFSGAESSFLSDVQVLLGKAETTSTAKALIPVWIDSLMYKSLGFNEFGLRLPNVVVLLLTFLGFYFFGKKLFGQKATVVTLLVMASSFLPVNFAKVATGDVWLFSVQLMSFIFLIFFLKQPINKWKWGVWIFTVLGALVHPLSMLVWSLGLWGYLQFWHPKKRNLRQLMLLPLLLIIYVPLYFFGYISLAMPYFYMGIGSGNFSYYFVIALLGILPWFGFLPAALWDMIKKLKKKEEMAMINLGWILLAIFSQSLVIVAAFSFIIAKNLLSYFQKNYPYKRLVKGFTLVNMIFTFCVLTVGLLSGFLNFQGTGYRSLFGVSALYWMSCMASVLGLFMMNNGLVTGGMAFSGLIATWLFWLQVNPLVESQRNLPQQVFQSLSSKGVGKTTIRSTELYHLASDSVFYQHNFQVYLNDLRVKTIAIDSSRILSIPSKGQNALAAIPDDFYEKLPSNHVFKQNETTEAIGGRGMLQREVKYQLVEF